MHLKSIELQGFKSFAHKINLVFNNGITGIVGPNGSGKSNIADAVRWVLGEQSAKQLRGSKMEDVIFAGTENRKPVGYSQVSINIDNDDRKLPIEYSEVTISRRVYRSGESEYYINGSSCRLKDIVELLMDTGIGKEGYSIIGQGQIDKILSNKPDDRRLLFDEAAGIVKFKRRKETAIKKLEQEKQNLIRIDDILRELENQKDQLFEQSETAKEFLKLKESLKKYEINIFLNDYKRLEGQIVDIESKEKDIDNEVKEVKSNYDNSKTDYEKLNKEIEMFNQDIDDKKDLLSNLNIEKEKVDHSIKIAKEQINSIVSNNTRLETTIENYENKIKECLNSKEVNLKLKDDLVNTIEEKTTLLNNEEEALKIIQEDIRQNESHVEDAKTNIIERLNQISSVKSKIQRYKTIAENLEDRKTVLDEKLDKLEQSKVTYDSLKTSKENGLLLIKKTLEDIQTKKMELDEELNQLHSHKKNIAIRFNEETKQLHNFTSRYNTLQDITSHYEGYNMSIRKVMNLRNTNERHKSSIHGVVADALQVNKKYELAIETALGGSIQNIITSDENVAKQCIKYLKDNKFGRATFLPMTSVKPRGYFNHNVSNEKGVIGLASNLAEYDQKYKNIIDYLLGKVVVVDHIDNAVSLARKYKYSLKIVTLTGDIINPGGSLTGGSFRNKGNHFLGRKRELDEIKKQIDEIAVSIEVTKKEKDDIKTRENQLKNDVSTLTDENNELTLKYQAEELKLNQTKSDIEKISEEIIDIRSELSDIAAQNSELEGSISELEVELEGSQVENVDAENKIQTLTEKIQAKRESGEKLSESITKIKIEINSLEQKQKHLKVDCERLEQNVIEITRDIDIFKKEISDNIVALNEKEQYITNNIQAIEEKDEKLKLIHQRLDELVAQKSAKSEQLNALFNLREELSNKISLLEKEILRLQNSKIKYDMQKENVINYMWDEYELTYNVCLDFKEDLGTNSSMKKNINELKEQIKELGDVNVNAIEDYRTVIERYTFLSEQKDDILEAEDKLKQVIEELNVEMTKQFKEKFREITERFNEVFRELFGGGKGILKLTDEENILQSGIHIVAQPPGKKLQSMMLLSGGERAFTAIALLFAIQSLKPSPFCVLDEIEAALDDANVERFANYLKKLSQNTQFIIITHRRGTMEAADTLYGITMQEKGISSLVSVKLVENQLSG